MDGLADDADGPSFDPRPGGVERRVPDDVDAALAPHFHSHGMRHPWHARRVEKDLRRRSAVRMHLLVRRAVHLDGYHRRGKGPGNCGRREEKGPAKIERLGIAAGGDLSDVPDDRLASIEIRGANEK